MSQSHSKDVTQSLIPIMIHKVTLLSLKEQVVLPARNLLLIINSGVARGVHVGSFAPSPCPFAPGPFYAYVVLLFTYSLS